MMAGFDIAAELWAHPPFRAMIRAHQPRLPASDARLRAMARVMAAAGRECHEEGLALFLAACSSLDASERQRFNELQWKEAAR